MKKYFTGLTAIICAIAFSAFIHPFAMLTFKLLHDPITAGIVSNPSEWSTCGEEFGRCEILANEIACEINLHSSRDCYYHSDNECEILNSFPYANAQSPKQCYLEITEARSDCAFYIYSITAWKWDPNANGGTGAYVLDNLGSDLFWKNGQCD